MTKSSTTKFLLTCTLRVGTVVKKTSVPLKNNIDFNTSIDSSQLKCDGDDVVFTGYLVELQDPFLQEKRDEIGKGNDYVYKIKNYEIERFLSIRKRIFFQLYSCFNRKTLLGRLYGNSY